MTGRHPRQRHHRRGRHRQPPHHPRRPARAQGHGTIPALMEVRGEVYLPVKAFERLNADARSGGRAALRQPAQRRRRRPPPARPRDHPAPAAPDVRLPRRGDRGRADGRHPVGGARPARGVGASRSSRTARGIADLAAVQTGGRRATRRCSPPCPSRPTASWSRWTGSRCTTSSAWSAAGSRAGRSRGSSRPRWPSPGCSTSASTWAAPARSIPTPCSSRSRSAASPSAAPRCTTRSSSPRRTSAIGDWVEVVRAGEVIPQVVGPAARSAATGAEQPFVMPEQCPACGTPVERPADEVDALLPQRLLPGPGARGDRALRLARGDGHPRPGLRAGAAAARRGADPRRGRPLRARRRRSWSSSSGSRSSRPSSWCGASPPPRRSRSPSCSSASASATSARRWRELLARRFGTMAALARRRRGGHQRRCPGVGPAIAEAVRQFFREARNRHAGRAARASRARHRPSPAPPRPTARSPARPTCSPAPCPTLSRAEATALIERAGGNVCRQREQEDRRRGGGQRRRQQAGEGHGARRRGHRRGGALAPRRPRARNLPARRTP